MSEPTILDEIVQAKKVQLESQRRELPLDVIKDGLQKSDRDFHAALTHPKPAFILECKKASPSKGIIRNDFDLAAIARDYSCLLYTSPSPRDATLSRMPSSA